MYDNQIFEKINKHYNYIKSLGYEIVAIFAQGSMNYNLYIQKGKITLTFCSKKSLTSKVGDELRLLMLE